MSTLRKARPSPALIVALIALVAAMSGAAVALPGKGTVDRNDLDKGAVTKKAIKKKAVRTKAIKDGAVTGEKLADGAVGSAEVADESLRDSDIAALEVFGRSTTRVTATDGPEPGAARTAAPVVPLASHGPFTVYAKCFRDTGADQLTGAIYIATSQAGSLLDSSDGDEKEGGAASTDFLNPGTPEIEAELATESVTGTGASFSLGDNDGWRAFAPDGTSLTGMFAVALKNGNLAGGNGAYGDGNVCLFGGSATG